MAVQNDYSGTEAKEIQPDAATAVFPRASAFWWVLLLLVLPSIAISFLTRRLTQAEEDSARQALAERVTRLEALRKADREALGSYRWIDRDKGVVAIPIERAMELEEERLKSKAVGPSTVLLPGALLRQQPSPAPKP
ncbi:MAG: hypothetical protein PHO89_06715 [Methylacidiphilaceae bacterium]|nr:hypothetical protein [Candidatus Methylacidiphilaceae bacterium]